MLAHTGVVASANDDGASPTVAIVVDRVPAKLTLSRGVDSSSSSSSSVVRFAAVVIASVGMAPGVNVTVAALTEHAALQPISTAQLLSEHTTSWQALTAARVEVGGVHSSHRAWQLQTHFWSSYYYLMSTIRSDWSLGGFSPGGLASQNYEGAVFMDQEFYMAQGLLLFNPALTESAAQYRIDSAPVAARIAKTFGYEGMMFAWTSAALGNPFGAYRTTPMTMDCPEEHYSPRQHLFCSPRQCIFFPILCTCCNARTLIIV